MKEGLATNINGPEHPCLLRDSARICGSRMCPYRGWSLFLVLLKIAMPLHVDGLMYRFDKLLEAYIP